MALCEFRWYSAVLQKQVHTMVLLPDEGKPPFPALYLLHGLSDDSTIWLRRTRVEIHAAGWPMIVVMPDGFRGFYTVNTDGTDYAAYIGRELPAMIERNFPARPGRAARGIGGQSMGGYGALRIALGFPDTFISANSHSGGLMAGSRDKPPERFFDSQRMFGPSPRGTDHNLILLARKAHAAGKLPKIRIDTGVGNHLLQDNRDYHQALNELGIPHDYQEFPGAHDWEYWNTHIPSTLQFHAKTMGINPFPGAAS